MGRRSIVPSAVVVVLLLAACSGSASDDATPKADSVTVASFNFAESELLAEIYSQSLEAGGFPVTRSFDLGPRELVVPALVGGLVDLVPEYAGTALQFLSAGRNAPASDSAATNAGLRSALVGRPIRALAPAAAQDANAFAVSRATAERYQLRTLSDLAPTADTLVFGGPPECASRPLCLAGLSRTYGITFADVVSLDAGGPVTRQALDSGSIDVALLFTTDPALDGAGIVELIDDRNLQPAENVTPLVREDVLARWGEGLVARIDETSALLTTAVLRQLNDEVDAGDDVATVAARWLAAQGLA